MQGRLTGREKHNLYNTLTAVVKALEGQHTLIDLRNESCVSGLIKLVDGNMNVEMEKVVFYDPRGNEHYFEEFYVSARNIRYVHIPESLSIRELIETELGSLKKPISKKGKETFKGKRAKRYQAQILADLQASGSEPKAGPSSSKQ